MHSRHFRRPDGRGLVLYGRSAIPEDLAVEGAGAHPAPPSHLRWHPLRGEWVVYAPGLRDPALAPPADVDRFAPARDAESPTELPAGAYDIAVLDDPAPVLSAGANAAPSLIVDARPGKGASEIIVYARDPAATLADLPLWHLELVVEVWGERTRELGARADIQHVLVFERAPSDALGAPRSHARVHGYPFIPPEVARQVREQRLYFEDHDRGLLEDHLQAEIEDGQRILFQAPRAVALVPVCARFPYETWVLPRRPAPSLAELTPEERGDFARALHVVLRKLAGLPAAAPYMLVLHQAPADERPHPEVHAHVQIYPALHGRAPVATDASIAAGVAVEGGLPEDYAAELRSVAVEPR